MISTIGQYTRKTEKLEFRENMVKFNDLTGKIIGRLTFLEHEYIGSKRFWKARCQCGEEQKYRADYFSVMKCKGTSFECYKCKMERRSPTLTDKIFGRLTVVKEVPGKDQHRWWLCKCECGEEKEIPSVRLTNKSGRPLTRSCGCLARKLNSKWVNTTQYPPAHQLRTKHTDIRKAALYHCRNAMVASCYRTEDCRYKYHGELGHTVCDLWRNGAKDFVKWAIKNGYKDGDGVFLKDGKTTYSPQNCFVMCKSEFFKKHNSKTIEWNGKCKSITEWANEFGCSISCLSVRLKKYKKYGLDKIMDLNWVPERKQFYGTEHLEGDIVRLYQEGKTYFEIGQELRISSSTVGRFLRKNNVKIRPAKCRSAL